MAQRYTWAAQAVQFGLGLGLGLTLPSVGTAQSVAQVAAPASAPRATSGDLQRFNSSIVRVNAKVPEDAGSSQTLGPDRVGTGIILDARTVLTIGYVTLEADAVMVTTASGKRIPASVAGYDHATGFGLVRTAVPLDGKPLPLGDSDAVSEKQKVLTLGHGEPEATEIFVLSRKPFAAGWEYLIERPIYTFPPVNNWSGAALITADGTLVGVGSLIVNDASPSQKGVPGNLFVPVNLLKPIMADLLANGRRSAGVQPWLGMTTEDVRGNLMVTRLARNGPAENAGVNVGDIVVGVGGDRIGEQADFYRKVWKVGPAGANIPLRLLKGGEVREVTVKSIDRFDFLRKATGI
jgi:S1-C subfamily serine protease